MKIALITDQHWGVRSDNDAVYDYQMMFYNDVFYPYLEEHDIKTLINLGDLTDRRKYISFKTLNRLRKNYILKLSEMGVEQHNIIGNHDTFYKNTNSINSLTELFEDVDNCFIYPEACVKNFDGLDIVMMPWINVENHDHALNLINTTDAAVLFGHLELNGFQMYSNSIECHSGIDYKMFNKFDVVCSGHFHHKSQKGNITYLGAPCEYTWSDYNDPRGFHVFDTETKELEYVKNPFRLFRKLYYNDSNIDTPFKKRKFLSQFAEKSKEYTGCFVKLIVKEKTDPILLESFVNQLYKSEVVDLKIIEDNSLFGDDEQDAVNLSEDTFSILSKHVDQMEMLEDKEIEDLKILLENIYVRALELEE